MFGNTSLIQQNLNHTTYGRQPQQLRRQAAQAFWKEHFQALLGSLWAKLAHQDNRLQKLNTHFHKGGAERRLPGIHIVPLNHIRGTEGRCQDFDIHFRPLQTHLQDRWVNIAVARAKGVQLPPVDLIKVNDTYYVRDGHHRISVAHSQGQLAIEALVTEW